MRATVYSLVVQLFISPLFAIPQIKNAIFEDFSITKIGHFASPYNPHRVACKYGVEISFDQPHFVPFSAKKSCPRGSSSLIENIANETDVIMCCLPECPYKHLRTMNVQGGDDAVPVEQLSSKLTVSSALNTDFPRLFEKPKSRQKRALEEEARKPPSNFAFFGFFWLSSAIGQLIVAMSAFWVVRNTKERIELDATSDMDMDLDIEEERPRPPERAGTPTDRNSDSRASHHPSRSLMMSDNMASDLMSVSQANN